MTNANINSYEFFTITLLFAWFQKGTFITEKMSPETQAFYLD